jgi:hypothetical protein
LNFGERRKTAEPSTINKAEDKERVGRWKRKDTTSVIASKEYRIQNTEYRIQNTVIFVEQQGKREPSNLKN